MRLNSAQANCGQPEGQPGVRHTGGCGPLIRVRPKVCVSLCDVLLVRAVCTRQACSVWCSWRRADDARPARAPYRCEHVRSGGSRSCGDNSPVQSLLPVEGNRAGREENRYRLLRSSWRQEDTSARQQRQYNADTTLCRGQFTASMAAWERAKERHGACALLQRSRWDYSVPTERVCRTVTRRAFF